MCAFADAWKTNPKQSQYKPNQSQLKPIKCQNKPNSKPIQTQTKPISKGKKMLLLMTINGRRKPFGYHADKIEAPRAGACPPTVEPGSYEISHSTFCLSKNDQFFFIYLWLSAKIKVLDFQVTSRTIFGEFKL